MTSNILIVFTRFTTERAEGDEYFCGYDEGINKGNWGWGIKDGSKQKELLIDENRSLILISGAEYFDDSNAWSLGQENRLIPKLAEKIETIFTKYIGGKDANFSILIHTTDPALIKELKSKTKERIRDNIIAYSSISKEQKKVISALMRECQSGVTQDLQRYKDAFDKVWEFFFIGNIINAIRLPLTPLHLSLQSFWGITIKNANENKLSFAKLGNNKKSSQFADAIRQKLGSTSDTIDEQYLSLFPNPDTFLLVNEAEYDFYAPLFDMVLSPEDKGKTEDGKSKRAIGEFKSNTEDSENGDLEKDAYEADTFSELLEKTKSDKLKKLANAFLTRIGDSWQKVDLDRDYEPGEVWFTIEIRDYNPIVVTYQLFVDCLRELCAILANTKKDGFLKKGCSNNEYFGYKGKKEFQVFRDTILKGINLLGSEFEHCKLNTNKTEYNKLVQQLSSWGIEKAMIVLGGIRNLAVIN